ncbi:DUF4136 domain-containing protein [Thalassotalea sp. PS06]|uniref:DUF4136 domain-containing protein n=1 Tax=Thalassotalea sp. PS06 TaxID=2594005 RepID=UPI00163DA1C6|nr:DUF4136 domain-containing protein [Thalassotalea sp. PS06]
MSYRRSPLQIIFSWLFLCLLITGCSSQPSAQYNADYDFVDISSYSLFPRHHEFNDVQRLSDFQRNRIELAIEHAMDELAFSYTEQDEADVVVSYFLVQTSLQELKNYNRKVKACLICTEKEQRSLNRKIRTDMLIIDLISTSNMRSVYRQSSPLKMKPKNTSDENRQLIIEAVQESLLDLSRLRANSK